MSDFSHLQRLSETRETRDFVLYNLEGEPVLKLRPATEANKPYFNGILRRARKNRGAIQAGVVSGGLVRESRQDDRRLYAQHVLAGWEGVTDSAGELVPFNSENALAFLEALPDWIFDEVRGFAGTPANFLEDGLNEGAETGKA